MDSGEDEPEKNRSAPGDANGRTAAPRAKRSSRPKRRRGGKTGQPDPDGAQPTARSGSGKDGDEPAVGESAAAGRPPRPEQNEKSGNRAKRRRRRKSSASAPREATAGNSGAAPGSGGPRSGGPRSGGPGTGGPGAADQGTPSDHGELARNGVSGAGGVSGDRNAGGRDADADQARRAAGFDHAARSRAPRRGGYTGPLYAALDLGTNNCRLLVARPEGRGFRVVDAYSRIVRLGEGIGASNRLGDAAMDRAIEALAICRDKLAECGQVRARLIATEACRSAENGPHFIERVRQETGLALEIVNRETEARLAVAGCTSLVDPDAEGVLLFDIGGGSSELVWLDLRNRCGARGHALTRFVRTWTSLPLGVVTLAERHGGTHVGPEEFEAMVADVTTHLGSFALGELLSEAIASSKVHMLGTSGTVTTLAGVHLDLERYDRRRVDGTWMQDEQVSAMISKLLGMSFEERVANPCIGADRADLVLAGCAILEAIRRRWPCPRLRVADRGLREGILTELMAADRKGRRRPPRRRRPSS